MPDENRIFDVTKPNRVNPSATSRPVIVGHRPEMADPMVKDQASAAAEPTKIMVNEASPADSSLFAPEPAPSGLAQPDVPADFKEPAIIHDNNPPSIMPEESATPLSTPEPEAGPGPAPLPAAPVLPAESTPHIEELHFSAPRRRRKWPWILFLILILLVGAYLAIGFNLVHNNINLPFFKQKNNNPPAAASNTTVNNANKAPAVPAGFSQYRLTGTSLTFAAPTSWGNPTSTAAPGYSKRSTGAQSDGTYAYVVDFATNKDVELAVTSSKYLPASGPTLYYDYLQWCTGSNDGKLYESVLHFTTADKVDTPTTITCDQGPVPNAAQINSTTIVQSKAQDTAGKTIGDIYTKNLTDPSLVVFRVKDAAMTNGDAIKQLLSTIVITAGTPQ